MERIEARNVVLGAGAMGSAAAYHLAKRGEPVVLVEQFAIGHDRGSSHGAARIARHSYADPAYARLMRDAFAAWKAFEADAGQTVYIRLGGVSFCPSGIDYVAQVTASLEAVAVPHRRMTGRELTRIYPPFAVPETYDVVFEPDAGMLLADRIVALQVELARAFGGEATRVLAPCPIRRLDLEADHPTLVGDQLRIVADRLIVAAGSWTARLLPGLGGPLRPTRQQVLYFGPSDPAPFEIGRFPAFIFWGEHDQDIFYGMPPHLHCDVKVARHGGPDVDPDHVPRTVDDAYRAIVRGFLRRHIPALADAPITREEICLYTVAPADQFLVDRLPERPDVVVASPCSGHGFKFASLIGRVLADLAQTGQTDIAIDTWSLARARGEL